MNPLRNFIFLLGFSAILVSLVVTCSHLMVQIGNLIDRMAK